MAFSKKEEKFGWLLGAILLLYGNARIIYISLTSTNEDKYLILYYPIAYLLTYCMPWLFSEDFKYSEPIIKIIARLAMVFLFGGMLGIVAG